MNNLEKIKNSLNLPNTNFKMRANLPIKEQKILDMWQSIDIYEQLMKVRSGQEVFLLHDGPPYANGSLHIGHAFNKSLKDIVLRTKSMLGYKTPFIPTWDCHGLPIEYKVEENLRKDGKSKDDIGAIEFRGLCRDFAKYWVEIQKNQTLRLGCLGDWKKPFLTMDKKAESNILVEINKFVTNGTLYQDLRPVLWSVVEETALAEYETEYHDITSTAVYVSFPIAETSVDLLKDASAVIWTTTPWTLPANRALAFGADIEYAVIEVTRVAQDNIDNRQSKNLIIAKDCLKELIDKLDITNYKIKGSCYGKDIAGAVAKHPMYKSGYDHLQIKCVIGSHVTVESGTGIVHTAPSHGPDDFILGKKYGLDIPETVNGNGTYCDDVPLFAGKHIFKVTDDILKALENNDTLLLSEKYIHSYPHSWRSKAPLIYRVTQQWFIELNKSGIKEKAIKEAKNVRWWPESGKNRMIGMLENRPDWCLSRQRIWGVPIAVFVNKKTKKLLNDPKVQQRIEKAFAEFGSDIWFDETKDIKRFLEPDYKKQDFDAVFDIVDVWFESGTTHSIVIQDNVNYPEINPPADMYLEGSDQHRGWFQSSLLESCGTTGKAPYKNILTHGFVLDHKGYKMSKSAKNGLSPEEIYQSYGAEILRLWTTYSDYYGDVRISKDSLKHCQDVYRKLRNTLRYLLGFVANDNIVNNVSYDDLPELERWVLSCVAEIDGEFKKDINNYNFKSAYVKLHEFCVNSLSSLYFDIRKDALYCEEADSDLRKSVLFVFTEIFNWFIRCIAPVLPFTAEEGYLSYHNIDIDEVEAEKITDNSSNNGWSSIHLQEFKSLPEQWDQPKLRDKYNKIKQYRNEINIALEKARKMEVINSSLQAKVVIQLMPSENNNIVDGAKNDLQWLNLTNWHETLMIAEISSDSTKNCLITHNSPELGIVIGIDKSCFDKCNRCWRLLDCVKQFDDANLCSRCVECI